VEDRRRTRPTQGAREARGARTAQSARDDRGARTARSRAVGSTAFFVVLFVLALCFAGLRLWTSDRGQALLVSHGLTLRFVPELATRADVALARCFIDMGLLRGDLKVKQVSEGTLRLREYTFTAPGHLTPTQCHAEIASAVHAVDGGIVHAEERHERGDELVLWVGFGAVPTHRIVVRTPSAARIAAPAHAGPRIALIIDDLGNAMNETTRGFLELPVPVTLAVLPDLPKSEKFFDEARKREIPTLLHLPMEPEGDRDPGKNAIRVGMSADEVDALVGDHLRHYKTFFGVNNHMGSRAAADRNTMRALMASLRKRDLVFIDSQTTPYSVGRATGREAGVWCMGNDLFLDDNAEPADAVAAHVEHLATLARKRGLAIGIAHPHPETLNALRAMLPRLQAEGIEFVTIDSLRPKSAVAASLATPVATNEQ